MNNQNSQMIEGTTIQPGQTYTRQFNIIETLSYTWVRYSVPFTPLCTINVLDTKGYVRNPNYDSIINFNILVNSKPTTINLSINPNSYQASIISSQEGTLLVTNIGDRTANNIFLSGEWITFSSNYFNLEPQQTKGVIFTVSPLVFNTSSTNKTYEKKIRAIGNFEPKEVNMSVFVQYTRIGDSGENLSDADYLINVFCPKYPYSSLCEKDPRVEYRYIYNLTGQSVNVSITQKKLDDLWIYLFGLGDEIKTYRNYDKDRFNSVAETINQTMIDISTLKNKVATIEEDRKTFTIYILYFIVVAFLVFSIIITGALIYLYRNRKQLEALRRWN